MEMNMGTGMAGPSVNQAVWQDANNGQVIPKFYRWSKLMPFQSEQEKRAVYKAMDMVKIMQAGEPDSTIEEVNEIHKQRWPQQWAQYQAGKEQMMGGIPLAELFPVNPEVVAQLGTVNVFTVEGLMAVPDSAQHNVPYLTEWKNRARAYMERTSKAAGFAELEHRLEAEKADKAALLDRLAALEAKMAEPIIETKNMKQKAA